MERYTRGSVFVPVASLPGNISLFIEAAEEQRISPNLSSPVCAPRRHSQQTMLWETTPDNTSWRGLNLRFRADKMYADALVLGFRSKQQAHQWQCTRAALSRGLGLAYSSTVKFRQLRSSFKVLKRSFFHVDRFPGQG